MDGVHDDVLGERLLAGGARVDPSLRERLVAGDENDLVSAFTLVPTEIAEGTLDDRAAVFLAAVRLEREQFLAQGVEIPRHRANKTDPVVSDGVAVVAVFIQGDLDERCLAVPFCVDEGVDDLPKLGFRLIDQAVHAVRGIEQDGDLDPVLVLSVDDRRVNLGFFRDTWVGGRFRDAERRKCGNCR